jgi:adenylate cyclase
MVNNTKGNYLTGLEFFRKSLKIRIEIDDKEGIAGSYNNIGVIYCAQGNYSEALKKYKTSLKFWEETGDKSQIADKYTFIGYIYREMNNYPMALQYCSSSLKIQEEIGDKAGIAYSLSSIGYIYADQKNYSEALKNFYSSLKIFEELADKRGINIECQNIGGVYIKQKQYDKASQYVNKALSLALETGYKSGICDGYFGLARLDSAQGNFKQSLEHFKKGVIFQDSLFGQENAEKIKKYEFEQKDALAIAEQEKRDAIAQRKLQRQKWVRNGFIGGFAVVMLFAFIFLGQRNKISKEKKRSEEERRKAEEERRKADAEKKRSEELLLNILPFEVAEELKQTGHCLAKTFSMVTVMFMDFKDFTSVSERVSAELLVNEINACFSAFDGIIQKYNVEKIKTVGDAYICAGGLPVLNQTHAKDIVNAAIEIQKFMLARKKEKEDKDEFAFEMRIGIHTGPVVAGIVGVKKFQYDIWGDTVNLAARMEQNSEAGKINISGSTYKLVKDKFNCTFRGKIEAKNKGEVEMYFVESNPEI